MNPAATYGDVLLHIDGRWRPGSERATRDVHNPATGQRIGRVACASDIDLAQAVQSARRAFPGWRDTSAMQRRRILHQAAQLLRQRIDAIATVLTLEQGKPLAEAKAEVNMAAEIIEWFADEGVRVHGRVVPARMPGVDQRVLKHPIGVVAAFTPWNFPVNQAVRKLAAALATGCTIVLKAAEETPASPAELVRAFVDAGLPVGVINLIYGEPAQISQYLIAHPAVAKISFTGSTAVGKQLAALAGQHMKRVTMELGGHAPVIVAADADPVAAAKTIAVAKFRNAGQVCACPTRFLVHRSIQDRFTATIADYAQGLHVGDGMDAASQMGPLANPRRRAAMQEICADASAHGGRLVTGGQPIAGPGNFFQPTVISDASLDSALWNEEPFGPVAAIRSFETLDQAIAEANRLPYGLAAYAFSAHAPTIHRLSQELEAGMVWINHAAPAWPEMPMGGVKDSGFGSEGGAEALEPYLITKAISVMHLAG